MFVSPELLADICAWLSEGMPAALVDELEVIELQPPFARLDHFERLSTLQRQAIRYNRKRDAIHPTTRRAVSC
ncbi:hypothetical protein [Paraburkholderia kirstenboschensis]|uniref:hypothetical protein n=1 Tax=Paraburkholderia kirstenboschensis TaxID=1245436 RepID=UPI0039A4B9DF